MFGLRIILIVFLITSSYLQAQPWKKLPEKKKFDMFGAEVMLHLVLDTLTFEELNEPNEYTFINKIRNAEGVDKIGYGYVNDNGEPMGIWRYYIKKGKGYQLFCEGSYVKLEASDLRVARDIMTEFPDVDYERIKKEYASELEPKFLMAGEWRFYKDRHLDYIIELSYNTFIPFQIIIDMDEVTSLLIAAPENIRHSGEMISLISFDRDNKIKKISTNNLTIDIGPDGKADINPMFDITEF